MIRLGAHVPGRALLLPALAVVLAATAGCQQSRMITGGVRAIWVTRGDFRTADDVTRIMEDCSRGGFNTVIFQVRGNGTVFYPSKIEPWAEQFNFTSPGFDPLGQAIQEAHRRGMELHAWVNVMPAWRGTKPPASPEQLYNKHPEWFWYDQHGKRQPLNPFYVSLNPCLPEVREYLVDVFHEIVANYPIDGLHLDYIRFPNDNAPRGVDYPHDPRTLALYREATGRAPADSRAISAASARGPGVGIEASATKGLTAPISGSARATACSIAFARFSGVGSSSATMASQRARRFFPGKELAMGMSPACAISSGG